MLKIQYSFQFNKSLQSFITYLKDYYDHFYSNTGIYAEEDIKIQYIIQTEKLYEEFLFAIKKDIQRGVTGNIYEKTDTFELSKLVVFVRSYILIVYCKKILHEDLILIENIEIRT